MREPILPGATVGILGSGQLGRMLALAARRMGYRVHVLSPEPGSPAGRVADREIVAPYDDLDAARKLAAASDVVTLEFENVPAATAEAVAEIVPLRPFPDVLRATQHRLREKEFLSRAGFPVARFRPVGAREELDAALAEVGTPAVLKTAGFGYDGKGQAKIETPGDADAAWSAVGGPAVLEEWVELEVEVSVVGARGTDGVFAHFGAVENAHRDHILDLTVAPAHLPPETAREAVEVARAVFEELGVVGTACVEFFVAKDGRLLVNEVAPRPHNSGHWTIEGAAASQFEQQLRAVCGLPLGDTGRLAPAAAMANLLGHLWQGGEPDWSAALSVPGVALHLYGKGEARPGRKMGHLTALADDRESAVRRVLAAREALVAGAG